MKRGQSAIGKVGAIILVLIVLIFLILLARRIGTVRDIFFRILGV